MARSAEVAYPRSQVSIYRTIGPLVLVLDLVTKFCHDTVYTTVNSRFLVVSCLVIYSFQSGVLGHAELLFFLLMSVNIYLC